MRERRPTSQHILPLFALFHCSVLLTVLILIPKVTWSQENPRHQFEIKSNVNLVGLHMTVRDRDGTLVGDLHKDDFQVYEDGVPQEVESFNHADIPITLGIVIDNSGSMQAKRPEVVAAAVAFARAGNPRDEMFVVNFNDTVSFGLPPNMAFTDRPAQLEQALSNANPSGRTALYDAISYALEHLRAGSNDKKALIVVSDGGDNASKHTLSELVALAVKSDAMIYTVGLFDPEQGDQNPHALKELAKATGGEAFLPESINDVASICDRIAVELRNQYAVAYVSSNRKQDGTYRHIKVKVVAPKDGHLVIRARAGYYAPSSVDPSPVAGDNRQ